MRITSLQVNATQLTILGENEIVFTFDKGVSIIFSTENSVGKTTLLRLMMYALGYKIPNTRGIRFSSYETILTVDTESNGVCTLTRNKDYIVLEQSGTEKGYSLPVEQVELHSHIFGISNPEVVENLLGAFYVDQEKGWTLLNRGKVIGSIRFSIESLLRGLSNKSNVELSIRLSVVNREIRKYKHMLDVAAYNAEINKLGEVSFIDSPAEEIENALEALYSEKKPLEDELKRLKSVIRKNTDFERYITSFKLRVKSPSDEVVPVNKDTLIGYGDTADLLVAKQKIIFGQISAVDRKIDLLKSQQEKENTLFDIKSGIQQFDSEITKITVDTLATQKVIDALRKERAFLEDNIIKSVKRDSKLVGELHKMISTYAVRLGLDEKYVSEKNDYIFTDDLKTLSGAIFHKVVFAFKVSYVKLIRNHTNVVLPIILDSPSGREVSKENIGEMMAIISDDFSDHQIIIASIHNDYDFTNKNVIELRDRLLPF